MLRLNDYKVCIEKFERKVSEPVVVVKTRIVSVNQLKTKVSWLKKER